jgi:hypothetical protein
MLSSKAMSNNELAIALVNESLISKGLVAIDRAYHG